MILVPVVPLPTYMGVRPYDVMSTLSMVTFFGAILTGAIATALNAWWTGPELEYGLKDSGARFAFVDGERFARLVGHIANCPALERVYVTRGGNDIGDPRVARLGEVIGTVNDWGGLPERPLPTVALAPEEAKRLRAMGIDEGARVAIAHRGIFAGRDPIAIMIGRMTVAIRRSHARAMTVTEV